MTYSRGRRPVHGGREQRERNGHWGGCRYGIRLQRSRPRAVSESSTVLGETCVYENLARAASASARWAGASVSPGLVCP
jgi:hypothetical protein